MIVTRLSVEMRYSARGETRYASGDSLTTYGYTGQRQEPDLGFYYYKARWYDPALGRFMQADTIVPEAGNPMALDRYGYTRSNPVVHIDPSGHCDIGFSLTYLIPLYGQVMLVRSCIEDVEKAIDAYEAGERRPLVLYAHGTGITDALVSTAEKVDQLNSDIDTVFSNAPIEERLPAAWRVGWFATFTSATIVGIGQMVKAGLSRAPIKPFEDLPSKPGFVRHHLIEQRFAENLGVNPGEIHADYLMPSDHPPLTTAWRNAIGYSNGRNPINTITATKDDLLAASKMIYADSPIYLKAILKFLSSPK